MSATVTQRHQQLAKEMPSRLWGDCPRCTNHPMRPREKCERCNGTGLDECTDADYVVCLTLMVAQEIADAEERGREAGIREAECVASRVARECAAGFMPGSPVGYETAIDIACRIRALPPEVTK